MGEMRKITAFLPTELLAKVQGYTGEGVTETLKLALEGYARSEWSKRMLALRGKGGPSGDILEEIAGLREDREFGPDGTPL